MYSGYAGSGNEEDGDEAKQMSKAYTTMVLALYAGTLLVQVFMGSTTLNMGLTVCCMGSGGESQNVPV